MIFRPKAGLPSTIEELHAFIIVGKEKLNAHKAMIRAIKKIGSAYAAKEAALSDAQDLAELLLDAESKLGEMLAAIEPKYVKKADTSFNGSFRSLPEGITHKESHQAQTISSHPEIVEKVKQEARQEGRIPTAQEIYREIKTPAYRETKTPTCSLWTRDQESYTPPKYIEAVRKVMGSIDLDPASNEFAQKTIQATIFFTIEDNGLDKPWNGNIFLNPPYSHPEVKLFVDKLLSELKPGQQAILLTNNNTDTNFFHRAARRAAAICFTKGRINFLKPDGMQSSPTNGQVFYYFGDNKEKFVRHFAEFGIMMMAI